MRWFSFVCLTLFLCTQATAQSHDFSFLTTRAEATEFAETSSYQEVIAFTEVVSNASDLLVRSTFGYTTEGRALPLVVFSDLDDVSAETVRASDKTRVLVLANIHAGEVCGKEASLMLLRALAAGQHPEWTDSLVVLFAPIYNADGNERVKLTNRPLQWGPVGGMGQRPNANGLDLNRDFMKADASETRSLLRLLQDYDPHALIDLHTTNGSYHGYHLTYAPPLHPNTPPQINTQLREHWLPAVTSAIKEKYGWDYYYYGNVPPERMNVERGWYTFDHRPRFGTNYTGLRNRFGILSEAYSYASFEDRVLGTYYFVEEVLEYAHRHASRIKNYTLLADTTTLIGKPLALAATYDIAGAPTTDILMGAVESEPHPYTGAPLLKRTEPFESESMREFGTFVPTQTEVVPTAYYVPDSLHAVLDRLDVHGIRYEPVPSPNELMLESFVIDSTNVAETEYQGHHAVSLFGAYEESQQTVTSEMVRIPLDQPLGRLAFYLLEPESDDGLVRWGFVPVDGERYPIIRQR